MVREVPHVVELSYCHPCDYYGGRNAGSAVRYLVRRPASKSDPAAGGWRSIPPRMRLGDARRFAEAADTRTKELWNRARRRGKRLGKIKASWCTSYVHILVSPKNRGGLTVEDFRHLAGPWTLDGNGDVLPHFGAVHTDGRRGPHLHLLVVRDRPSKGELAALKARTGALALRLERERAPEWVPERTQERERTPERTPERENGTEREW